TDISKVKCNSVTFYCFPTGIIFTGKDNSSRICKTFKFGQILDEYGNIIETEHDVNRYTDTYLNRNINRNNDIPNLITFVDLDAKRIKHMKQIQKCISDDSPYNSIYFYFIPDMPVLMVFCVGGSAWSYMYIRNK